MQTPLPFPLPSPLSLAKKNNLAPALVLALLLLPAAARAADPVVSNVTLAQRAGTKLVDITYNVTADTPTVFVSLEISSDGGTTFGVPAATVSGAIGAGVATGTGKTISWDSEADWREQYSLQVRFKVTVTELSPPLPVGFSLVPAGAFTMGDSLDGISDAPVRTVTLSAFYMGQKEVTMAEWDAVRTWAVSHGYADLPVGAGKATNHPVQTVSWWDVVKWCNALSELEGLSPCYTVSGAVMKTGTNVPTVNWATNGYRLPTEAEWEKAARAGLSGKRFPWGNTISHAQANFRNDGGETYQTGTAGYHPTYATGSLPYTSPVGSFTANGYGLQDMAGNVFEWCWDWWGTYASGAQTDPRGAASGSARVVRGGSWFRYADLCRAAYRTYDVPANSSYRMGFRPARSSVGRTGFCVTSNVVVDTRADPVVGNVTAAQRAGTKLVDISYDVTADSPSVIVSLEISSDGGTTFSVPATTVSGAIGAGVPIGTGKLIIWNVGADWSGQYSARMRYKVTATIPPPAGFSLIPAGAFTMGDSLDGLSDAPSRTVTLSAFFMGQQEVTKAEWDATRTWALSHGYTDLAVGAGKATNHPVQTVSWWDVIKWCNARSEKDKLTPCYYTDAAQTAIYKTGATYLDNAMVKWTANGYRLPTEAEWEKAARGGLSGKRFPWGDTISHSQANYYSSTSYSFDISPTRGNHPTYDNGVAPGTSPVGSFSANGYGLQDMAGNVFEWCWDWYGPYASGGQTDPRGAAPSGSGRVIRGGSWNFFAYSARCACRFWELYDYNSYGFRLTRGQQ